MSKKKKKNRLKETQQKRVLRESAEISPSRIERESSRGKNKLLPQGNASIPSFPKPTLNDRTPSLGSHQLRMVSYKIVTGPMKSPYSKTVQQKIEEMHDLIHMDCHEAIPLLQQLIVKYPHVPMFCNYLCMAYSAIGDHKQTRYWAEETYRRHPDYLFGKINMAELYLRERQVDQVAKLFGGQFELQLHYPQCKRFHISEVLGFYGVTGHYYLLKGQRQQAKLCYNLIKQLAPHHPQRFRLQREMYFSWIWNLCAKVLGVLIFLVLLPILIVVYVGKRFFYPVW